MARLKSLVPTETYPIMGNPLLREVSVKGVEEAAELAGIQASIEPQAAAHVEAGPQHPIVCLARIARMQPAGQQHRNADAFPDPPADRPVVHAASAAELLDRKRRVPRVEQDGVDERR